MANRTFAVGDIHGDLGALKRAIAKLPPLDDKDTYALLQSGETTRSDIHAMELGRSVNER